MRAHRVAPRPDLATGGNKSTRVGTCSYMCDSSFAGDLLRQLHLRKLVDILQHSLTETELSIGVAAGAPNLASVCKGKTSSADHLSGI